MTDIYHLPKSDHPSDVRTIHESMTRSRSSLLAVTWQFRSQAQIQLPAPGLDNDQTALPREGQYRQMPSPGA